MGLASHHCQAGVPKLVATGKPDELRSITMLLGVSFRGIGTYRNLPCPYRKWHKSFVFAKLGT